MHDPRPPLVGRDASARRSRGCSRPSATAPPPCCVIEGEPGIGKSRMLAELAAQADGCTVLAARASEYEADLPYALWEEALGRRLAPAEAGGRVGVHRVVREALERLAAAARSSSASTTCTGPTRARPRRSPRSCTARSPRPS